MRWREERLAGLDNPAAVQRAMETAGHSVVFSGTTVTISLLALVALPVPFIRSIGIGGMLIPLVSVLVAITLLPALLATVGPRFDWPHFRQSQQASPTWQRLTRLVIRHHFLATLVALANLAVLIFSAFGIKLGQPSLEALAQSGSAYNGLTALEKAGLGSARLPV